VSVTDEPPLLETTNASSGQVVDSRRIAELPIQDGNPTMLTRMATGVTATGSFGAFNQPFANFFLHRTEPAFIANTIHTRPDACGHLGNKRRSRSGLHHRINAR